jgi:hypothetical protein
MVKSSCVVELHRRVNSVLISSDRSDSAHLSAAAAAVPAHQPAFVIAQISSLYCIRLLLEATLPLYGVLHPAPATLCRSTRGEKHALHDSNVILYMITYEVVKLSGRACNDLAQIF